MRIAISLCITMLRRVSGGTPPAPGDALLIETGDVLLMESGDKVLLEA